MSETLRFVALHWRLIVLLLAIAVLVWESFYSIGPTQVGLVRKRFGKKLPEDNPVAFHGEAGYQAELLMPGLRFKLCLVYVSPNTRGCRYRPARLASSSRKLGSRYRSVRSRLSIRKHSVTSPTLGYSWRE